MATLGTAYVQIVPSAQGISGKIQSAINPEANAAGASAGKTISSKISSGLGSVGGALTKYVTKPVMAAGAAMGGLTLAKGWSRMVEIDNARAKLKALGQDADAIKESANAAVSGTAYSLNKAMTTAASAAAAGIKPGQEMTRYLTNIADAAAVAGVDMDEMGAIFNKVATNGKMSAEEMNQLSDRGIPVMQLLAKTTGKSMDEVRDAMSSGEIGIQDLQKAIEEGMDGAAKSIGSSTISGAISNVMASIGRIGANLLGSADDASSIAGKILPLLNAVMTALGPLEERAKTLGASIAGVLGPAIDRITNMLSGGETAAERAMAVADMAKAKMMAMGIGIAGALGPIMVGVSKLIPMFTEFGTKLTNIATKLGTTRGGLLKFGGVFGLIVAGFITAYTQSESFRNAINQLAVVVGGALLQVFTALSPLLQIAAQLFASVAKMAGDILGPVLMRLTPIISAVIGVITRMITTVVTWATKILSAVNKISSIRGKISKTFSAVKKYISSHLQAAKAKVSSIVGNIKTALSFSGLKGKVSQVFTQIKDAVKKKMEEAKKKVKGVIDKIKGMFPFSVGKIFSGKISLPKISVSKTSDGGAKTTASTTTKHFAKAMDNPYMFGRETVFAAGEAGDEMLYGHRALMNDISAAVKGNNSGGDIIINLNYDATDDATDMLRDLARGVKRYRMAGAF